MNFSSLKLSKISIFSSILYSYKLTSVFKFFTFPNKTLSPDFTNEISLLNSFVMKLYKFSSYPIIMLPSGKVSFYAGISTLGPNKNASIKSPYQFHIFVYPKLLCVDILKYWISPFSEIMWDSSILLSSNQKELPKAGNWSILTL